VNLRPIKHAVKTAFATPLAWRTVGALVRQPGVIVLTYHRIAGDAPNLGGISVAHFAEQMRWVREVCEPIGPDALLDGARWSRRQRPAVLVTFDDGYRSYHDYAYPILKQYDIPAAMFLITSLLDDAESLMWTDRVQWAALSTTRTSVHIPWLTDGVPIQLPDAGAKAALGSAARSHLKAVPNAVREERLDELVSTLGGGRPQERQMMTWDEVRRTMDLTTYGGHTHTHPILSRLDRAGATREIVTCRDRIAAETGRSPTHFAYPNGMPEDYTRETQDLLREAGFRVAFCSSDGIAGADTDWMAVKRISSADEGAASLAWMATGRSS
jgi:peptidoglycan/xylan/chitin deacetylase (PgdA/CDA1 family)